MSQQHFHSGLLSYSYIHTQLHRQLSLSGFYLLSRWQIEFKLKCFSRFYYPLSLSLCFPDRAGLVSAFFLLLLLSGIKKGFVYVLSDLWDFKASSTRLFYGLSTLARCYSLSNHTQNNRLMATIKDFCSCLRREVDKNLINKQKQNVIFIVSQNVYWMLFVCIVNCEGGNLVRCGREEIFYDSFRRNSYGNSTRLLFSSSPWN